MKQTIEVEVPDGAEVADVIRMSCSREHSNYQIRFRPVWQYPEWLGGAGVAMDSDGVWKVHLDEKPELGETTWGRTHFMPGRKLCINWLGNYFPLWTPPPCDDWRESWHPNPKKARSELRCEHCDCNKLDYEGSAGTSGYKYCCQACEKCTWSHAVPDEGEVIR